MKSLSKEYYQQLPGNYTRLCLIIIIIIINFLLHPSFFWLIKLQSMFSCAISSINCHGAFACKTKFPVPPTLDLIADLNR